MSSKFLNDKKKKLQAFKNTTNTNDSMAKSYLEKFSWDLMRAVDGFYANESEIFTLAKKSTISMERVNAWFDSYIDPDDDEDSINEEGILKFCDDIGVDPQDIVVLVIAWKMQAAYMCAFTRREWQKGMQEMDCDSVAKLKAKLPQLRQVITSTTEFKKFYSFCFGFSKEPGQKSLSIDIAVAMWELLLSTRFEKLMKSWLAFLAEKKPVKGVTRDTWDLLFDFFVKVRDSYATYNENEAWPVLIDDYMHQDTLTKVLVSIRMRPDNPSRLSIWCNQHKRAILMIFDIHSLIGRRAMDLSSLEMLPTCTFFPRDYMQQYKQQVKELMKRMERLLEEEEALETDKDAIDHSIQVIALSSETVWQNLAALQDCHVLVDETLTLFKLKIQESVALVTADPSVLERMSSIPISEEYSSSDDMDETDEVAFQDVEPVKGRKAAVALNNDVTERVYQALQNEEKFKQFKANALAFGMGNTIPETFYTYLAQEIPAPVLDSIVVDFARLLPQVGLRVPLLKAHYDHMKNHLARPSIAVFRNKSYSRAVTLRTSTSTSSVDEAGSSNEEDEEYPSTIRLRSFNHLVFVIHGIGQHIDFRDGEFKSWNGETGIEGGNHAFRDIFRTMLETTFQNIPMALEMQSIEWHEDLHEPTGLDNIFDLISPEGASAIREFNKETFMDVLYYLSPRYGQLIVDSVTKQLNEKYRVFINEHPGWDGKVSIFAHSLGSMISYDILTHKSGEIASNGVRFPGLEFEVDNFFGVGSPVGVMILARGDLNINDGEFTPGIKIPNCRRYFNLYHPIDPVAYRIEPLIKQEMHDKEPVQLMQYSAVKDQSFGQLQEVWEGLTSPVHGFPYRHDYVMRRRKREQGMMEVAFAAASHSSYWMSDDVVLFTLMQLCEPVVDILHRYMSAMVPLPKLVRSIVELTPHAKVLLSATALVRDRCTGLSREHIVLIDKDRLFFLSRLSEVACRRKWRLKLTAITRAMYGDDPFMMKIVTNDASASSSPSAASPASNNNAILSGLHVFKASSTPDRNAWLEAINETVAIAADEERFGGEVPRDTTNLVDLPTGKSIDYFNAIKAGFLKEKTANGWYDSWNDRWLVLQEDHLTCYENSPKLDFVGQFPLRKTKACCYEREYLIRVVARRGAACEMRVQNQESFDRWVEVLARIPTVEIIRHEDLLENSPSSVLIMSENSRESFGEAQNAGQAGEWLKTKIEGYQIKLDESDQEYVAFVIQVASSTAGNSVVQRRYSEFAKLHHQLRKMFQHEQIPALPGTRMWNKFEPNYLKQKAVALHGYLNEVCKRCANTRALPLLLEFLELAPPASLDDPKTSPKEENAEKMN